MSDLTSFIETTYPDLRTKKVYLSDVCTAYNLGKVPQNCYNTHTLSKALKAEGYELNRSAKGMYLVPPRIEMLSFDELTLNRRLRLTPKDREELALKYAEIRSMSAFEFRLRYPQF